MSALRSRKCEAMGERLKKALAAGVVDRGLPFNVARVEYRDDGTAWARLEIDLLYGGRPMKPESIAEGMLSTLAEVAGEPVEAPPKKGRA